MAKEIITTIKRGKEIFHGILNEDTMQFSAVGRDKYGSITSSMNIEGIDYVILKETIIEFDDKSKP